VLGGGGGDGRRPAPDWCSFTCGSEAERVQHRQRCDYVLVQCPHGCGDQFSAKLLARLLLEVGTSPRPSRREGKQVRACWSLRNPSIFFLNRPPEPIFFHPLE